MYKYKIGIRKTFRTSITKYILDVDTRKMLPKGKSNFLFIVFVCFGIYALFLILISTMFDTKIGEGR